MNTIPLTKRGAEKLKEELHRLKTVERHAVVQAIAEARAQGVALRHEIASLYHQLGQEAEALAWAQSALQRDPQHRPSRDLLEEVGQALEQAKGAP